MSELAAINLGDDEEEFQTSQKFGQSDNGVINSVLQVYFFVMSTQSWKEKDGQMMFGIMYFVTLFYLVKFNNI